MGKLFANLNLVLAIGLALAVLIALFPGFGLSPAVGDLSMACCSGCTSSSGSPGSACSIISTSCRRRPCRRSRPS